MPNIRMEGYLLLFFSLLTTLGHNGISETLWKQILTPCSASGKTQRCTKRGASWREKTGGDSRRRKQEGRHVSSYFLGHHGAGCDDNQMDLLWGIFHISHHNHSLFRHCLVATADNLCADVCRDFVSSSSNSCRLGTEFQRKSWLLTGTLSMNYQELLPCVSFANTNSALTGWQQSWSCQFTSAYILR